MKKVPDELKKRSFRHVGIGLPDDDSVHSIVRSLIDWGAIITREDEERCKYFLKLNPGDVLEIEIYLSERGTAGIHFDKSVEDIVTTGDLCDDELSNYDASNIFFLPLVTVFNNLIKRTEIDMAFCEEPFDWAPWISKIEDVAVRNDVLEIHIPEKEWERLESEKMASLKERLTPTAADRLHLFGCATEKRFLVTVCRICGPCANC